jgi:hypothetical protein
MYTACGIVSMQLLMETEADYGSHCVVSQRVLARQFLVCEAEGMGNM